MPNLLARVPKSMQALVATTVRTIYQQPSADEVHAQHESGDKERARTASSPFRSRSYSALRRTLHM